MTTDALIQKGVVVGALVLMLVFTRRIYREGVFEADGLVERFLWLMQSLVASTAMVFMLFMAVIGIAAVAAFLLT